MIGYLSGKIKFIFEDNLILDVNGIGYKIYIDSRTLESLKINDETDFFIHTIFRDDSITLYGFKFQTDYELFTNLITVSGIGAKTALNVLAKMSSIEFARAIYQKNLNALMNLPGIGKKSAQRLILELKDKLEINTFDEQSNWQPKIKSNSFNDASEALTALGYNNSEIAEVFQKAKSSMTTEELIKFALKELNRFG